MIAPDTPPQAQRAAGPTARDLILDLFGVWDAAGTCNSGWKHPANDLPASVVNATCSALVADGLVVRNWVTQRDGRPHLTELGRAALRSAGLSRDGEGERHGV